MTNGEHEQMMRNQEKDLNRIATALEMANQLKVLELGIYKESVEYKESHGFQETYDKVDHLWGILSRRNGYK